MDKASGYDPLKRLMDVAVGSVVLVLASPLILGIALAVKRDSAGPVFYRGVRAGRRGRPFLLHKFRTMAADAETRGGTSTASDDPRITPVGAFLRKFKLDELPNLWDVLRGEMSLVGPRAQVLDEVAAYSLLEREVLTVRPGITDFASIRFRNEGDILRGQTNPDRAYQDLIRPEKMRLALEYVRARSLATDLRILWQTFLAVTKLPGAPDAAPTTGTTTIREDP